ncbi:MAG: LTA synthase family protein [Prevotellaceae bacterium]|jgi:phosphoglycerol transferase MdoB-like AlkP superfamily enzyme|nr:LTA synthase family protein [Prevotellaceae bacterium]
MKETILKYRFNILFFAGMVIALYANLVTFYSKINNPLPLPGEAGSPVFYTFINCLIFLLPYFFFQKKRGVFILIYFVLIDTLLLSNTVYYRFYKNIIPFFSLFEFGNLKDMAGALLSYFRFSDFIYFLNTLILLILYLFLFRKKIRETSRKSRLITSASLLLFSFVTFLAGAVVSEQKGIPVTEGLKHYNQAKFASVYGLLTVWTYQIGSHLLADNKPLTESELALIDSYISKHKIVANGTVEGGKNLIIILVESLDTWAVNFDNGSAAPFLKKLSEEEHVIFIPNVLTQVSHGRSSDAQLMLNTGLLPVFNNTVAGLYSKQYYPSIARCLKRKDYSSSTIMGNEAHSWNQQTMNYAYHIDDLISQENLVSDEIIGYGISDKSVFRQVCHLLNEKKEKSFYTQIITLSSHDAIDFAGYTSDLAFPAHFSENVRNYIKSIEYVDAAIKDFFECLKATSLYDNSIIVIVGDHYSPQLDEVRNDRELLTEYELKNDFAGFVPLYIVNSERTFNQKENQVIGQIDIYPSLLDIMGVSEDYWPGMGTDIFSEKPPVFAVDKNLNAVGDTENCTQDEIAHKIAAWEISDLIIRKDYFGKTNNKN